MNEHWLEVQWSWDGSKVTQYYGQHGYKAHKEADGRGWSIVNDPALTYIRRLSGGVGYSSVTVSARGEFSYRGIFDGSGTTYRNAYRTDIVARGTGTRSCSQSHYWRNTAPGWSLQKWCGGGAYGEK